MSSSPITIFIQINSDMLFPDLPADNRRREELFINNYHTSYTSGSYNLPPNRSQFEFIWSNYVDREKELQLEILIPEQQDLPLLAQEISDYLFRNMSVDIRKEFFIQPCTVDPIYLDAMDNITFIMAYNLVCYVGSCVFEQKNMRSKYKKLDFLAPLFDHHVVSSGNMDGIHCRLEWANNYRNLCMMLGCNLWKDISKYIRENQWDFFWNHMKSLFAERSVVLSSSVFSDTIESYRKLEVPEIKNYIKKEYSRRQFFDNEDITNQDQLVWMIENNDLSVHVLQYIKRILEKCHK